MDERKLLDRFLMYGSEDTIYEVRKHKLNKPPPHLKTCQSLLNLVESNQGRDVVNKIVEASNRRINKVNPAHIHALALCTHSTDIMTKRDAYKALPTVCKNPPDLFLFNHYREKGWGKARKKAISRWYTDRSSSQLAIDVTRFISRHGWTHKDLIRLAHLCPEDEAKRITVKYTTKGFKEVENEFKNDVPAELSEVYQYLEAVHRVKHSEDENEIVSLIDQFKLHRDHISMSFREKKEVWRVLIPHLPLCDLIPNMNRLHQCGHFSPSMPDNLVTAVVDKLRDAEVVHSCGLNPVEIYLALKYYENGKPALGQTSWEANKDIVEAFKFAFLTSISSAVPSNKSFLIALDMSPSTTAVSDNSNKKFLPLFVGSGVVMLVSQTEKNYSVVCYDSKATELKLDSDPFAICETISKSSETAKRKITDISLPITWALENNKVFDAIIVLTDRSSVKESKIKNKYPCKLVVVSLACHKFNIASEEMDVLEILGFDDDTSNLIKEFILHTI